MNLNPMAREFAALCDAFLQKFPTGKEAMIEWLEESRAKPGKRNSVPESLESKFPQRARRDEDFVIWTGSGAGTSVRSAYISKKQTEAYAVRKSNYDIFISGPIILVNGNAVILPPRLEWLLIIFLRYRNQFLPPEESFRKAWGHSALLPGHDTKSILQDYLRFAVSELRHKLKPLITAGKLAIPNKHRDYGYRCEGRLSFCIIVDRGLEPRATLRI
jgi:hypothetical protein